MGRFVATAVLSALALAGCSGVSVGLGSTQTEVQASALPSVPGVTVVSEKFAPGVAGNAKINYVVLSGSHELSAAQILQRVRKSLVADDWKAGPGFRSAFQAISSDGSILAIGARRGCTRIAAPRSTVHQADVLSQAARPVVCVTLAPH